MSKKIVIRIIKVKKQEEGEATIEVPVHATLVSIEEISGNMVYIKWFGDPEERLQKRQLVFVLTGGSFTYHQDDAKWIGDFLVDITSEVDQPKGEYDIFQRINVFELT